VLTVTAKCGELFFDLQHLCKCSETLSHSIKLCRSQTESAIRNDGPARKQKICHAGAALGCLKQQGAVDIEGRLQEG
jgi:hypothetical protein